MGHFDGRLKEAIRTAASKARGQDGAFYDILKTYNFFDVADTDNSLTDWQRAGVPEANQHRMSALCSAVTDMFVDFLGNDNYGVMTTVLEDIIAKLDQRGAQTAGEVDVIGGVIGGLTGGASESARQAMSSAIAAAMEGNKFDPDVIPPISIGLNGLPISIANYYKPGFVQPNWPFLYDHESRKESGFFDGDGGLMLGPGIPMSLGGKAKVLVLKAIFAVPTVDEHGNPVGDMEGGLTEEQFELVKGAMDKGSYAELTDEEKSLTLTDEQSRASYFRYVNMVLWDAIRNRNNWAYLHWGVLSHNSMPEPVKTAVCSFLKTNGLALDAGINGPAAMISYCLNIGMAYLVGRHYPVTIVGIPGQKLKAIRDKDSKEVSEVTGYGKATRYEGGVPKDPALARLHFGYIADILIRLTNGTSEYDTDLRKRRVDEANLIYGYCGYPKVEYGSSPASVPAEVKADAIVSRGFLELMNSTVYVFPNRSGNYGAGANVKIEMQSKDVDPDGTRLQPRSRQVLQWLGAQIGVDTIQVASLVRDPDKQGGVMCDNWHRGKRISYGAGGTEVNMVYVDWTRKHGGTQANLSKKPLPYDTGLKVDEEDLPKVKDLMRKKAAEVVKAGNKVSNHCCDPAVYQAIDISATHLSRYGRATCDRAVAVCRDAKNRNILQGLILPDGWGDPPARTGEPALHIEVDPRRTEPSIPMAVEDPASLAPDPDRDVAVKVDNDNLTTKASLDVVFVKDNVDLMNERA
jgi:hypothetical protein